MNEFEKNKAWSDTFIPEIKRILGEHLIATAPFYEDAKHNTDLIMCMDGMRIACRVRSFSDYCKYKGEFTVRSKLMSGEKTELHKVVEGWGDYNFYGFANENEVGFVDWFIGNLNVFRLWFSGEQYKCEAKTLPGMKKENPPEKGGQTFRVFKRADMPEDFFIASSAQKGE